MVHKRTGWDRDAKADFAAMHQFRAQRQCLRCGKEFVSSSIGNRICDDCARINARRRGATARVLGGWTLLEQGFLIKNWD